MSPKWKLVVSAMRTVLWICGGAAILASIYVLLMPWRTQAFNLFGSAWRDFLITEGSSTVGTISNLISGVAIVAVTIVLILRHKGAEEMKKHWRNEAPIAFRVAAVTALLIYGPVLIWKFIAAVSANHEALVSQNEGLRKVIKQAHGCWMANLGMKPPSNKPEDTTSGNTVVFWCAADLEAPLSIEWDFTEAPKRISVPFFPDISSVAANAVLQGDSAVAYVERPSLLKFRPTALNIFGMAKLAPQATRVIIRPLSKTAKLDPTIINATDLR